MTKSLTFEEFVDAKDEKGAQVFIFLLENEYNLFNKESYWINNFALCPIKTVRCTLEEFKVLDIGIHPKTVIMFNGKEYALLNGLPAMAELKQILLRTGIKEKYSGDKENTSN